MFQPAEHCSILSQRQGVSITVVNSLILSHLNYTQNPEHRMAIELQEQKIIPLFSEWRNHAVSFMKYIEQTHIAVNSVS